jgi:hypothetical protein
MIFGRWQLSKFSFYVKRLLGLVLYKDKKFWGGIPSVSVDFMPGPVQI